MSRPVKFGYFLLSLISMSSMAVASIEMADGKSTPATLLFVISGVLIVGGIMGRRKFIRSRNL